MKIQHVLFAERSFVVNGKVMIDGLLPDYIVLNHAPEPDRPTVFGFSVIISILNPDDLFQASVIIEDPSGNSIAKAEGHVEVNKNDLNFRENMDGLSSAALSVDFRNFPWPGTGDYRVKVQIGEEKVIRILKVTLVR